ncbi:MAG: 5-formyltetrahydrofolate cyclo-ligase [Bdellovibrionota bacterium]
MHAPPKKERRSYYRRLLEQFSAPHFQAWNERLGPCLVKASKEIPRDSYVAVYRAKSKEADLSALFHLPLRFCFPRVLSDDGQMEFRWVKKPAAISEFETGAYGILEPKQSHPVVPREEMSACFAPLLAFDASGRRLGNGKGFYDRFLDGFKGLKIGVGFEWQYSVTPLPDEAHDQRLDLVVTECETRNFR